MGTCAVQVTRAKVPRFKEEVEVPLTFTSSRGGDGATGREIKNMCFYEVRWIGVCLRPCLSSKMSKLGFHVLDWKLDWVISYVLFHF